MSSLKFYLPYLFLFLFFHKSVGQNLLGGDTLICDTDHIDLKPNVSGSSYQWSTDETAPKITIYESGSYIVQIATSSGIRQDTITVKFLNQKYNQANHWPIGNNQDLAFTTANPPTSSVIANNAMLPSNTSVSDNEGKLLFYTSNQSLVGSDGTSIQPNMYTDNGPSQNSILFNKPKSSRYYYLFTILNGSLNYTLLDKEINGSKGGIVPGTLNKSLATNILGGLTAFKIKNSDDYWLVSHQGNNTFIAFKVDKNGISAPVYSITGSAPTSINSLKFNMSGDRLSMSSNKGELFKFDSYSGKVELMKEFNVGAESYGTEFSQDGSKLFYISRANGTEYNIQQIDLYARSGDELLYTTIEYYKGNDQFTSIQMGPDGKIYISKSSGNSIAVIENPSNMGASGNFNINKIILSSGTLQALPNFPQHYFSLPNKPAVFADNACDGNMTELLVDTDLGNYDFAKLNITFTTGEAGASPINTGKKTKTMYQYQKYGNYILEALVQTACTTYQLKYTQLKIFPKPTISINDTSICEKIPFVKNLTYNGGNANFTGFTPLYLWKSEQKIYDSVQYLIPEDYGTYYATVAFDKCTANATFKISKHLLPIPELGAAKESCTGESVELIPDIPALGSFKWQDASTNKSFFVTTDGLYKVIYNDGKCEAKDSVTVRFYPLPIDPMLKLNDTICQDSTLILDAKNNNTFDFLWSNGATTPTAQVKKSGAYSVEIYNNGCRKKFNAAVYVRPPLTFNFSTRIPLCFLEASNVVLDAGAGNSFLWQPNKETTPTILVDTGFYSVTKYDQHNCYATRNIEVYEYCEPRIFIPDAFTPNGDNQNEIFKPIGVNIDKYDLKIFNRWGEMIFYSSQIDYGWDGTYLGKTAGVGVYAFTIDFTTVADKSIKINTIKGIVNLLR